ncbi:MAG: polyphosphate kinase 1 [Gemmatimonadota bacterium]
MVYLCGAALTSAPKDAATPRIAVRYELRSAGQLDALVAAELPAGARATAARRTMHRDFYIDTKDETLRRRGVTCRLRLGTDDAHRLSLRIDGAAGERPTRVDDRVRSATLREALAENTSAGRRIRALIDPDALIVVHDLEVERWTRFAFPGLLRGPRVELHFDAITIRQRDSARTFYQLCGHQRRGAGTELESIASLFERQFAVRPVPGDFRELVELLARWKRDGSAAVQLEDTDDLRSHDGALGGSILLNPELSLVAFQWRVLAMAQYDVTPLRERLRFLGIVTNNIDELYMVRMPALTSEWRARVTEEVERLLSAQSACAADCLREAERLGVHIVKWDALTAAERDALSDLCRDDIHPGLTPLAVTLSPGHPLPHLAHLGLSLAVVFRRDEGGRPHLAEFELPSDVARLLPVPGRASDVIAIEDVLRANVHLLHPNAYVEGAYLFRVTRRGDLALDEEGAEDLLVAVETATERRPYNPAIRVEVERTTPSLVRELILESLRRDAVSQGMLPCVNDVQVVDGLLDLRCLAELPLPARSDLEYPPLVGRSPVDAQRSMFDVVRGGDLLVQHPFDAFDATVVRFVREAADDSAVTAIKITLYRVGDPSPIVGALLDAAKAGKRVVAFVELKARFDEEHNVAWARALERAGGNVVYGLVGLKTHAKVALVVRREGEKLQRYVHVGTGNYNARAGRQYTDLSLFSARDDITSDIADLFNELTGSSRAPKGLAHGALVAPHQLLPAMLALIERETAHARASRSASIAIKVNGLTDPEIIEALYEASAAGVRIDMVVRGICTLRPGLEPRSANIRVVSVVGRFLEHSRIYRFANGGDPTYLIGSADLRPRNLRRRVELLVPIANARHRQQLDRILDLYLNDATAWEMDGNGNYRQRVAGGPGAQEILARSADTILEGAS